MLPSPSLLYVTCTHMGKVEWLELDCVLIMTVLTYYDYCCKAKLLISPTHYLLIIASLTYTRSR